jgi:hypothetical protein
MFTVGATTPLVRRSNAGARGDPTRGRYSDREDVIVKKVA